MGFKKWMGLGLAAVISASLFSTGVMAGVRGANEDPANTTVTDENITIGLASEPSTLWGAPTAKTEGEGQVIQGALLDTLVKVDKNTQEVIPNLATEWEWLDNTHCKFTLRDDVYMTDGTPLVADDVVYTVGIWTEYSASNDTGRFVAGAEAQDDHTVVIEYAVVAPDLIYMMEWSNFGIVSEDEVNAAGGLEEVGKNPVIGCGKYKFVEWKSGQSITLERNDNYWNKDWNGYFKTITLTFTNDSAARVLGVQSGDTQVAYQIPVVQAATFADSEDLDVAVYSYGQVSHLWYNMGPNATATADARVRQAIDMALDFDALAVVGTAGYGQPALGYFPEGGKYYNETYTAEERAVDIEGAKALLAEAGYGDGLELKILGTQDAIPVYTVIQECLRNIGISLTLDTPDTPTFVQSAFGDGDYDLIMVGELTDARYPTLIPFLVQANVESGFVIGGPKWTTPEIDAAITEAIEETDEEKAKEELGALEQVMKENYLVSNLYPDMTASVVAKDIKGYTTIERGMMDITNFYKE